jgi:hypothetical protein
MTIKCRFKSIRRKWLYSPKPKNLNAIKDQFWLVCQEKNPQKTHLLTLQLMFNPWLISKSQGCSFCQGIRHGHQQMKKRRCFGKLMQPHR